MSDPRIDPREVEAWTNIIRIFVPPEKLEEILREIAEEGDQGSS